MVITRFAPSPTGDPHIGNIRTALFGYLFAKKNKGRFLLRIEDTDQKRLNQASINIVKEALRWLEIIPENINKPMIQSQRLEIYHKAAFELVEKDMAYICTCSEERLKEVRACQKALGKPPGYDSHCRKKTFTLAATRLDELPEGTVIRMKLPENKTIEFNDLVRGKISVNTSTLDDSVILKSDGFPTYHLAAVVDDHEMKISHVIRAEEWLPSTPKHVFLHRAFGWEPPEFAHLPVILGPNKGKLSKRDGATGILEYKKMGYLPDALINFMILLGWNPKDDKELFVSPSQIAIGGTSLMMLEKLFKIEYVNKSPAVFDIGKLNHFNEFYLKCKTPKQLQELIKDFDIPDLSIPEGKLLERGGFKTLKEMAEYIKALRQTPKYPKELLVFKKSTPEATQKGLKAAAEKLEKISDPSWKQDNLQKALEETVKEQNLSNGDVFWPVRVALSGAEKSPSPVELLVTLKKEESINRIKKAL
ncbi:MAG: glutamate--tRNA ligase [Candidatus Berkelbacteria bacterium]|nr:glutamate--tRNA ligase [Candidatus Berkelbacteria bacterium]